MLEAESPPLFRDFEIEALRFMLAPDFSESWLQELVAGATLVSYNYSGSGYFLTVAHPTIPTERSVFSYPPVVGRAGELEAGFVALLQDGELMLECHTWGGVDVPPDFRDLKVEVSVLQDHQVVWVGGDSAA